LLWPAVEYPEHFVRHYADLFISLDDRGARNRGIEEFICFDRAIQIRIIIGLLGKSGPAQFPKMVQAPKGAPNVLLILIDDCGFGQFGTFGGGIPSPTMDKLAAEGLRYNRFHTTALCSPTRAVLITGRNHHCTAFAGITELATGYDGFTCILPRSCGTCGEVMRQNGYMTAWIGKNHNTPTWETLRA
jgi:Sulfatase